jgi:hypothetical protein
MQSEYGLEGGVSVADLVRFPGALERVEGPVEIPEEPRAALGGLLARALDALDAMRRSEGERLRAELERLLQAIEAAASRIEGAAESRSCGGGALGACRPCRRASSTQPAPGGVRAVERHDVAEEAATAQPPPRRASWWRRRARRRESASTSSRRS